MTTQGLSAAPKKEEARFDDWLFRAYKLFAPSFQLWTPVLTFTTPGNLSVAYTTQLGEALKTGDFAEAWFRVVTSSFTHTTASGNLAITGLPFPSSSSSANMIWTGALSWAGITKANYTNAVASIVAGSSIISVGIGGSGQAAANVAFGDVPTGGTVVLRGYVRYRVN